MNILDKLSKYLQEGEDGKVYELTRRAIDEDIPPGDILNEGLLKGMDVVGERFKAHQIFLPDVLLSARAMYAGMDELKPLLIEEGIPTLGKVVMGTVQGDLHDIGKNLVSIMLEGAGFEIIDLGKDVPPHKFVETAGEEDAQVIGMSALLTTTMTVMGEVINLLQKEGLSERVKVIIGGAPVSVEFAREIGATAYGYDATNAVDKVKVLTGV